MSILGNPITLGGGGADLNIDFGSTPPADTSKLWVPLGKKPDKVICSAKDLTYGFEFENLNISVPSTGNVGALLAWRKSTNTLYLSGGSSSTTTDKYPSGKAFKISLNSKQVTNPSAFTSVYPQCGMCIVGNKLYSYGGVSGTWYNQSFALCYDLDTETLVKNLGTVGRGSFVSIVIGTDVYSVRTDCSSPIDDGDLYKTDTVANTVVNVGKINGFTGQVFAAQGAINNKMYIFGGSTSLSNVSGSTANNWFSIVDPIERMRTQVSVGKTIGATSGVVFDKKMYYLQSDGYLHSYDFDTKTDTSVFDVKSQIGSFTNYFYTMPMCAVDDGFIFVGCDGNSSNVYKLTLNFPLPKNTLALYYSDARPGIDIVNDKSAQINIAINNAFIGNDAGIAEAVNAYYYDTATGGWKSLDGTNYTRDMLNALNIMGVN